MIFITYSISIDIYFIENTFDIYKNHIYKKLAKYKESIFLFTKIFYNVI